MKLTFSQLNTHLTKPLAPLYLVSSDELLLAQEALDSIRRAARQSGFTERLVISGETHTDWKELIYESTHTLSLFASQRLIEVRLNKPNSASHKALEDYASHPIENTLLLIHTPKLDTKTTQSRWYQAIEKAGVVIPIWPITKEQLPEWIIQRAQPLKLVISPDAAKYLANLVEGNLLAAAQEIEKLALYFSPTAATKISIAEIEAITADNSRFDIFNLIDCILSGDIKRSLHILENLQLEGVEPILILWAMTRELRMLAEISNRVKEGKTLSQLFTQFRIWEKRQALVRHFLQRHTTQDCWKLLLKSAKIDRIIKGAEKDLLLDKLQDLILMMAK